MNQTNNDPTGAKLPTASIRRMSLYVRELQRLDQAVFTISSRDLAARLAVSADLVRHDLSLLGAVGKRGVGYEVPALLARLRQVLGTDLQWRVILVGTGSLGHALLRYQGFNRSGFQLVAALDIDPARIGSEIGGVVIRDANDLEEVIRTWRPQLAILAVPSDEAGAVAVRIAKAGVSGILNFAPTLLKLADEVAVVNVDLASEMQRLAFEVAQQERLTMPPPASEAY